MKIEGDRNSWPFKSDMIYERVEIFFPPLIYLEFPPFFAFRVCFVLFFSSLDKGEHFLFSSVSEFSYRIFFHANPRFHLILGFQPTGWHFSCKSRAQHCYNLLIPHCNKRSIVSKNRTLSGGLFVVPL